MSPKKFLLPLNLVGELIIILLLTLFSDLMMVTLDVILSLIIFWVIGTLLTRNYYINRLPGVLINLLNLTKHFLLYFLVVFVYLEIVHENEVSHPSIFKFALYLYLFMAFWRWLVFSFLKRALRKNKNRIPAVIVGVSVASIHYKAFMDSHPEYGLNILGFFSDKPNDRVKVLGTYEDFVTYCMQHKVAEIICSVDKVDRGVLNMVLDYSDNYFVSLKIIPDSAGVMGRNLVTTFIEHMPLLALRKNPFDEATNQFLKRGFDIAFSLLVIIFVLSWLLPLLAIVIKIDSTGPVFFVQQRSGIRNKTFRCFKFRSMKTDNNLEFKQATKNDNRVTKVGAFLRKTSLDEFPQFFNVLIGNMSIVGPRPHPLKLTEEYSQKVDKYMSRHLVKPGITGLSQVMGYRGETQDLYLMKMRVRMDRFYIENWSFYLDLKVVWATFLLMLRKDEKAY